MIGVTMLLFSGRPNPRVRLSEERESELLQQIDRAPLLREQQELRIGGLGFRGFLLRVLPMPGELGPPRDIRVYGGLLDDLRGRVKPDLERQFERTLLEKFKDVEPMAYELALAEWQTLYHEPMCKPHDSQESSRLDGRPRYDPAKWNRDSVAIEQSNCYAYANDKRLRVWGANPGTPDVWMGTKAAFVHAVKDDGLRPIAGSDVHEPRLPHNGWPVALFIRFNNTTGVDYHFYRQDDSGRWSHKPNLFQVRDCDEDGQPIVNIGKVNALDYKLCGIFETTRNVRIR